MKQLLPQNTHILAVSVITALQFVTAQAFAQDVVQPQAMMSRIAELAAQGAQVSTAAPKGSYCVGGAAGGRLSLLGVKSDMGAPATKGTVMRLADQHPLRQKMSELQQQLQPLRDMELSLQYLAEFPEEMMDGTGGIMETYWRYKSEQKRLAPTRAMLEMVTQQALVEARACDQ